MPLNEVPDYLRQAVYAASPPGVVASLAEGGGDLPDRLAVARTSLEQWTLDDEFWATVEEFHQTMTLEGNLEVEGQILSEALGGDRLLAESILLEASETVGNTPQAARQAVFIIVRQCSQVQQQPPSPGRLYRLGKTLRRVFKAAGGGILIAADIVTPDPSLLTKVASVAGGIDMIVDAVRD